MAQTRVFPVNQPQWPLNAGGCEGAEMQTAVSDELDGRFGQGRDAQAVGY